MGWLSFLKGDFWKAETFLNIYTMAGMNQYFLKYSILSVSHFSLVSSLGEILLKSIASFPKIL